MATRSSRRKKFSLQDNKSESQEPNPLNTTTRSRKIRQKENSTAEDVAAVGKFVKYPQETPVKNVADNAGKSTRAKQKVLKDKNVIINEAESNTFEKSVVNSTKRGRKTRTKKSPKNVNNHTKISDNSDNEQPHNETQDNKQEESESVSIPPERDLRTSKRKKGKSKYATPECKISDNIDSTDSSKAAGSFVKPPQLAETSLTNMNTSVDSFHSAAGSPTSTTDLHSSLKCDKELNFSDKNALNSTITLSDNVESTNTTFNSDQISGCSSAPTLISTEDNLLNTTFDKIPERCSNQIKTRAKVSEDIFNTSIVLVDSSIDTVQTSINIDSKIKSESSKSECNLLNETFDKVDPEMLDKINGTDSENSKVPNMLRREGTFTKESPDVGPKATRGTKSEVIGSPVRTKTYIPAAGSTPYHSRRKKTRSAEKSSSVLNLTHSLEKKKSSLRSSFSIPDVSRPTKVMFCSPATNPVRDSENKAKIIKSSMKGSNKSFLFEENTPALKSSRKRSYTHEDAETMSAAKRKKIIRDELTSSINRLSQPKRKKSKEATPPSNRPPLRKSLSETKPTSVRSKLPNFAALHKRAFSRMESLSECQARKALRSRQILQFSSGTYSLDGRKSPMVKPPEPRSDVAMKPNAKTENKNVKINVSKQPEAKFNKESKIYTRFGFKLQTDINPFSIPSTYTNKNPLNIPTVQARGKQRTENKFNSTISHLPKPNIPNSKLNGSIPALRREKSKQAMMTREVSSTKIVEKKKKENRDIIKGVRTNRRFELQMKSRNIK